MEKCSPLNQVYCRVRVALCNQLCSLQPWINWFEVKRTTTIIHGASVISVSEKMDTAPLPSKKAATSSKSKAVADNADSDSESSTLSANNFSEGEEEEVELSPKENQYVIWSGEV